MDSQQNYMLSSTDIYEHVIDLHFTRAFDTCDKEDHMFDMSYPTLIILIVLSMNDVQSP